MNKELREIQTTCRSVLQAGFELLPHPGLNEKQKELLVLLGMRLYIKGAKHGLKETEEAFEKMLKGNK